MYYELYIDVFFLENFMLDSLLLMAVNRVMQYRNSYARMLAGGAAGSFLTCVSSVYEICRSVLRSICSRILCIYGNVEVYIAHKTEYEKSSGSNIVYKSWGKESDRSYRYGK